MLHTTACSKAADAILALINSRPQSPTVEEVVAIIATTAPAPTAGTPKLRAEWDALHAATASADAKCRALSGSGITADVKAAEAEANEADRRLSECAWRTHLPTSSNRT
jgi:hypothetical protein